MRNLLLLCVFVLLSGCAQETVELPLNGIYEIAYEGKLNPVTRTFGGEVFLVKKLTDKFGKAKLWSTSNQNDRFRLQLKNVPCVDTSRHIAIFINGTCELVASKSAPENEGLELIVDLRGSEHADRVAKHLKLQPELRQHPGHQLVTSFRATKQEFKIGEPVVLEMSIRNAGRQAVHFYDGGQQRGTRNNQFSFVCSPPLPDTGDPMNFGGMASYQELKPGQVFKKTVDVSKWFDFEKAESYTIKGLFELELHNAEFDPQTLWDDFAIDECDVLIVE